ncbi:MAG: carbohydrate kinase [Ruminococcaceae bacterium]|jgi:fructokinase|nr:carbohydrate kinase [Oscillospiraceae bacterium]
MGRTFDVVALGELLIDFTSCGLSSQGNPLLEANPGGAPCNVLAMLRKLGRSCAFLGKVGADSFGDQLEAAIVEAGIDPRGLRRDPEIPTTLAVVHTKPDGDRSFSFYRKPGADVRLAPEDLDEALIRDSRIFHFGSLSLTDEPVRSATHRALALAREAGAMITYDPNLRPPLWPSAAAAKAQIEWGMAQCDAVKISDNEVEFLTGTPDFDAGAAILKEKFPNLRLICLTAGPGGSYAYYGGVKVWRDGCRLGGTIETTGAGDTFCACMLDFLLSRGLDGLTGAALGDMLRFANAAAYLVTTKKGALRVMPTRAQVEEILAKM